MKETVINCNGSVKLKCDHPLWAFTLSLGTLTYGGTLEIKRLSCGGQSIVEFYVFSVLLWQICRISVFGKFSCGTYVIVIFNSNIVVFLNMRNFFVIGLGDFSMVVSNFSISLCSVTVFRTPLVALQSFFLRMRILLLQDHGSVTCYWTGTVCPCCY